MQRGYIDSLGNFLPEDAALRPYGVVALTEHGSPWFTAGYYRKPIDAYKAKKDLEAYWSKWAREVDVKWNANFGYVRRQFKPITRQHYDIALRDGNEELLSNIF